jgi:hypothetical protein
MSYMSGRVGKNDTIYRPKNVGKYVGNPPHCVCRSSWELVFCKWADMNPAVIEWASEPMGIPYVDRATKDYRGMPKKRRYFPDFIVKILNRQGVVDTWLVEVKAKSLPLPQLLGAAVGSMVRARAGGSCLSAGTRESTIGAVRCGAPAS